jgi:glycosyltransferase involved in cell wall biosynthesis
LPGQAHVEGIFLVPGLLSINTYNYRRGGSDAVFLDHDALFQDLGWQTAVFAMRHPKNLPSSWEQYFVDEIEFGHDYSVLEKLSMAGKIIYSWEARAKLKRLLERFRPDIAHAHCIYHHISPSILPLLKQQGVPIVMTAHDLKLACPAYKMLNRSGVCEKCKHGNLLHLVANRCVRDSRSVSTLVAVESGIHKVSGIYRRNIDRVIAPSRFFREKLIEWGWSAGQVEYVPNFVRPPPTAPQFPPGRYFIYFGRLAPEKGLSTLVRAAARAGIELKIVGTGPEEEKLKRLAHEWPSIEFCGYRSGMDLWELVKAARAVVLPSEWYENAPMAVLEAFALGKVVVGARIGGIPELIDDGVTGFLFASGNADDLEKTLACVAMTPDSRLEEMGRAAEGVVRDRFNVRRYVRDMLDLYSRLNPSVNAAMAAPLTI